MPHISNLYRPEAQTILMFKEVFCLEKIDGTGAKINFNPSTNIIQYFSGGSPHEQFVALFNNESLLNSFKAMALPADKIVSIFLESYGGKIQGMSKSYGPNLKAVAYAVTIGECWLDVLASEKFVKDLGLEFVHFVKTTTDLKELDKQRDEPSVQAIRNGITTIAPDCSLINPRKREGIIILPLKECRTNLGRIIAKHKSSDFRETVTPRKVDPSQIQKFAEANQIANEYVTENRLGHVLQKIPNHSIEMMREILDAVLEDVLREGQGEIVIGDNLSSISKAIKSRAAVMYKNYLKGALTNSQV